MSVLCKVGDIPKIPTYKPRVNFSLMVNFSFIRYFSKFSDIHSLSLFFLELSQVILNLKKFRDLFQLVMPSSVKPRVSRARICSSLLTQNSSTLQLYSIEQVQDKCSGCITSIAQLFVAKCYTLVVFLTFNHRDIYLT